MLVVSSRFVKSGRDPSTTEVPCESRCEGDKLQATDERLAIYCLRTEFNESQIRRLVVNLRVTGRHDRQVGGYYHFTPRPVSARELLEQLLADEELLEQVRTLLRKMGPAPDSRARRWPPRP